MNASHKQYTCACAWTICTLIKVEIPFECGQQRVQSIEERTSIVAQEDTLKVFKTMCEVIISDRNDNRFKAYQEKIDKEKEKKIFIFIFLLNFL